MKKLLILAALLPVSAFAHGSLSGQAANAVQAASNLFNKTQTPDARKQFSSVSATLSGHERFAVEISLKDRTTFRYDCSENEEADPIVWECTAI